MPVPLIDLFAGPGGLNEGFGSVRDGRGTRVFRTAVSVEYEPWAHRTLELRALFRRLADDGETRNYYRYVCGEISRETLFERHPSAAAAARAEALLAELGASDAANREIEEKIGAALARAGGGECILIGGPPCQAYSLVGRARRKHEDRAEFESDAKHTLYQQYLRIVKKFKPAAFLMENVPGLLSAKHSGARMFQRICNDLLAAGYSLHSLAPGSPSENIDDPWAYVVRADEFGVPQARARVFILGLRSDLGLKSHVLEKTAGEPATVRHVLGDLPRIRSKLSKEEDSGVKWMNAIRRLRTYQLHGIGHGFRQSLLDRLDVLHPNHPLGADAMERTDKSPTKLASWFVDTACPFVLNHNSRGHMASDLMRYFYWSEYAAFHGRSPHLAEVPHFLRPNHGNISGDATDLPFADRFRVQLATKPSTTVVSHIAKDGHYYIHYEARQCRSLSVREAARLQTFPDNYFFEGRPTDAYRQVGNAVPPYLAMKIAEVVQAILHPSAGQSRGDVAAG